MDKISVIEGACYSRTCNFKPCFWEGVEVVCCSSSKNDLVACAHCLISSSCGSGCLEVLGVARLPGHGWNFLRNYGSSG